MVASRLLAISYLTGEAGLFCVVCSVFEKILRFFSNTPLIFYRFYSYGMAKRMLFRSRRVNVVLSNLQQRCHIQRQIYQTFLQLHILRVQHIRRAQIRPKLLNTLVD